MARANLQSTLAAALLLLTCLRGSAAVTSRRAQGRRLLQDSKSLTLSSSGHPPCICVQTSKSNALVLVHLSPCQASNLREG